MFDDEKELNNQNSDDINEINGTEREEKQPEYINSEDNDVKADNVNEDNNTYYGSNNSSDNNADNGSSYYNQGSNYNQENNYDSQRNYYDYNPDNNYSGPNYGQDINNNNNKKDNNNKKVAAIAAIAVAAVVLVGGIKIVSDSVINSANKAFESIDENSTEEAAENKEYPTIASTVTDNEDKSESSSNTGVLITDVSDVVEDVMPSIVAITSTTKVESNMYGNDWFYGNGYGYGQEEEYEEVGAGSGIIVKQTESELLIVTNNHVVTGADSLSIQFANGTSIDGVTKSTDEEADIAIVSIPLEKIDSDTLSSIKIATLGSSDDLKVGEGVVAIGNALGYGQSVTTGVISAKEREIAVDNKKMVVLQTDAAINGGNSGGALLNSKGEVIGINVAKYSSSSYSGSASVEGMGFAIPISQATDIINNLMSKQTRTKVEDGERGYLGVTVTDSDETASEMYSIPQGIFVRSVTDGGAADKAGIRPTDVITKFDGQSISTSASLVEKLEYYKAGETVVLTIQRNSGNGYEEVEVSVVLGSAEEAETQTRR